MPSTGSELATGRRFRPQPAAPLRSTDERRLRAAVARGPQREIRREAPVRGGEVRSAPMSRIHGGVVRMAVAHLRSITLSSVLRLEEIELGLFALAAKRQPQPAPTTGRRRKGFSACVLSRNVKTCEISIYDPVTGNLPMSVSARFHLLLAGMVLIILFAPDAQSSTYTLQDSGSCVFKNPDQFDARNCATDLTFSVDRTQHGPTEPLLLGGPTSSPYEDIIFIIITGDWIFWEEDDAVPGDCTDVCAYISTSDTGELLFLIVYCSNCLPNLDAGYSASAGFGAFQLPLVEVVPAPVPLPATLPLSATAAAIFFVLRRRNSRLAARRAASPA